MRASTGQAEVVRGVRVGIDLGTVRVGVASSDPDGILATPVETVPRDLTPAASDVRRLAQIVAERAAEVVYLGLPTHLSGAEGSASAAVRTYGETLASAVAPVPVRLVDERMSTVTAHRSLRAAGRPGRRHRQVVDQVAAVVILQAALDGERSSGRRWGVRLEPDRQEDGPGRIDRGGATGQETAE